MFGLLAGVAFVACTNDDDPASVSPVNGGDKVATAEKSYMKVNFVMPGGADTRADDAVFEAGSTDENQVNNGVLFFFDGKTQVADPFIIDKNNPTWTAEEEGTNINIEKKSGIIIVLENPLKNPTSVVALLNADLKVVTNRPNGTDAEVKDALKAMTLDELKKVVSDFATGLTTSGKFVMSSSAYNEAENKIAAKIPADKIFDERSKAKDAASVKIPVERVVAKVEVNTANPTQNLANADTESGEAASNKVKIVNAQGEIEEVELTAVIKGWWLDNTASTSLLLKDITGMDPADNDGNADPTDPNNHMRSYWANPVPGTLKHSAWKVADTETMALPQYIQENVASTDEATKDNNYNATQVVVAVQLMNGNTPIQLVKYLGKLYTQDGFNTKAINVLAHKYFVEDGNSYKTVSASDFKVTYVYSKVEGEGEAATTKYYTIAANGAETAVTIPTGVTIPELKSYQVYTLIEKANADDVFYVKNDAGAYKEATAAEVTADLKGYTVQKWNDGMAYYFTAIKHDDTRKAVIRNHVYKVKVNSINGLGTPVPFTDSEEIIPIIPENKETYISAEIDILAWKIVENNVDLTAN